MGHKTRILYLSHDSIVPSGGVKAIYHHVSHLVQNAYPAFVVHNKAGFSLSWMKCKVPTLYIEEDFQVFPNDIIVIPEDYSAALDAFRNIQVRKYVFCQNHFYIFKGLQKERRWEDFGICGVFCSSEIIREFVRFVFGYNEVPVVHYAIPSEPFKPRQKRLQVAYMPRKRAPEIDFIKKLFNSLYPQYKEIPWICIDKVEEAKAAQILGESAVFLSTSLYEGFGLPPVEAMACGCIVVGFHGYGGLEYVSQENGFWCEEGNIIECAITLGRVVSIFADDHQRIDRIRQRALKTAAKYTPDRQEKDLIEFWGKVCDSGKI